jgi:hypothetical protein
MESLDAEFSGMPYHHPCGTHHSLMQECPESNEDIQETPSVAERKAQEAKAAEVLTPVERFVARSTEINYRLFKEALDESVDMVLSCYGEDWIPAGDAQWLMMQMDHARNFLTLAETYFRALSTPLMQAAHIHIQHQMHVEAHAIKEPSAEQRTLRPGQRVRFQDPCSWSGQCGTIMEGVDEDGDFLVKNDAGDVQYHSANCMTKE